MSHPKDYTSQTIGYLKIIRRSGSIKESGGLSAAWECQCQCGKTVTVSSYYLKTRKTPSCGCTYKNQPRNLTGQKFGRWTVIGEVLKDELNYINKKWLCECSCEKKTKKNVTQHNLITGISTSCGCYNREQTINRNKKPLKINQRIGTLTVISEAGRNEYGFLYNFKCDCGVIITINRAKIGMGQKTCGNNHAENIIGKKFNRLTAKQFIKIKQRQHYWLFECECGKEKIIQKSAVVSGYTKSCGCLAKEISSLLSTKEILPGTTFGRLKVIKKHCKSKSTHRQFVTYLCECECGNTKVVESSSLRSGSVKSCGCLVKELQQNVWKYGVKHGLSKTKEYKAWKCKRRREWKILSNEAHKWTYEMELLIYDTFKACVICGRPDELEIDHVLPLSSLKPLEPGNATVLCCGCNSWKGNKSLRELPKWISNKIIKTSKQFEYAWAARQLPINLDDNIKNP